MENTTEDKTSNPDETVQTEFAGEVEADDSHTSATVAALMDNLKVMVQERDDAKESALRALADLQNFRRRAQQEKDQLRRLATEQLVVRLLPVLDNFERTIMSLEHGASVESVLEGIRGIDRQIRTVLQSVELRRENVVGQPFDPEVHEALGTHDDPEMPENTVTHELEAGYRMSGSVIRPAKVKVSKRP
jgi:molecular chaperone GrpE